MISKSEFLNRVHGGVFPLLKKVEQERIATLKKWGVGMIILAVALTVGACYLIGEDRLMQKHWAIIPILTFMIPILIGDGQLRAFSYQLKEKFIPSLYDLVGLKKKEENPKTLKNVDFEEDAEQEVLDEISGFKELLKKGLFEADSYLGGYDDEFRTKDNSFYVKEIQVSKGHGKGERTVFDGFVFKTKLDVKIGGKILILQKVNFLSSKRFTPQKSLNYHKMVINDALFDRRFHVYGENEADVKSVLNKMFLRQILSLRDIYPKAIINLLIENGQIIVAIHTGKDMFEFFSIYRSLLKDKFFEQFYDEVAILYKIKDLFG